MIQQSKDPKNFPPLLKQKMEEWMYETFQGLHWTVESLRHNTDEMRKEIQKLKERMK